MFTLKTQNQKRKKTLIIDFFYYYYYFVICKVNLSLSHILHRILLNSINFLLGFFISVDRRSFCWLLECTLMCSSKQRITFQIHRQNPQ